MNDSEALFVAMVPLKVVQEAPDEVSPHILSMFYCPVQFVQVLLNVGSSPIVADCIAFMRKPVPYALALSIVIPASFNLVRRRTDTPNELFWKGSVVPHAF